LAGSGLTDRSIATEPGGVSVAASAGWDDQISVADNATAVVPVSVAAVATISKTRIAVSGALRAYSGIGLARGQR
jgi:hypothetical protein